MSELQQGLTDYFVFYNTERQHQSLNYVTPDEVYRTASGGGARIVDLFGKTEHPHPEPHTEPERRGRAVPLHVPGSPLTLNAGGSCRRDPLYAADFSLRPPRRLARSGVRLDLLRYGA